MHVSVTGQVYIIRPEGGDSACWGKVEKGRDKMDIKMRTV